MSKLYRGKKFGVFTGANGYYIAEMASDGRSHYQPASGGNGWSESLRRRYNQEAAELEGKETED
jgi:hypothetical protein